MAQAEVGLAMKYGAMNNPMIDVYEEIALFADLGFDYIDLTLEPEQTYSATVDVARIAQALQSKNLGVVGHTAWYLPVASGFPEFRDLAIQELERCLRVFNDLGVSKVNLHPHLRVPLHDESWIIEHNVVALARLVDAGRQMGITVLLENMPGFSHTRQLQPIMDAVPDAAFLLDVGHANLDTPYNRTDELLAAFGSRLRHVHVSDNRGGHDDMHLPLGVGNIKWPEIVAALKSVGYDETMTLEVFGDDDDYLVLSRQKIGKLWDNQS
jgi:sugar phosphate isomerase/epimerase